MHNEVAIIHENMVKFDKKTGYYILNI